MTETLTIFSRREAGLYDGAPAPDAFLMLVFQPADIQTIIYQNGNAPGTENISGEILPRPKAAC